MRRALLTVVSLSASAVVLASTHRASAATTCTWQSTSSSSWSVAANWSCGHVPAQVDDVVFPTGAGLQYAVAQDIAPFGAVHAVSVTGGAYSFSGNMLLVGGGIFSASALGPLFLLPVKLNGSQTITNAGPGPLVFQTGGIDATQFALTFAGASEIDVLSVISGNGNGSVIKSGANVLVLEGANTYGGATSVTAGTVRVKSAQALGSSVIGTTLSGTGAIEVVGNLVVSEPLKIAAPKASPVLTSLSGTVDWAGALTLSANAIVSNASGATFTLSGAIGGASMLSTQGNPIRLSGVNTFSGGLTVETNGELLTQGPSPLGAGPVVVANGSGLMLISAGPYANAFTLSGPGPSPTSATLHVNSSGTQLTGPITVDIGATIDVVAGSSLEVVGSIGGPGALSKRGGGPMVLATPCSYSGGATIISGGSLVLGKSNVLPDATVVSVLPGATLSLSDQSDTVGSISGGGAIDLGSGTLTFGNASNATFAGAISGPGGIVVKGTGIQTFTSSSNYAGPTTVQGILHLAGASLTASNVTVAPAGRVAMSGLGSVKKNLTVNGGTVAPGFVTPRTSSSGDLLLDASATFEARMDGTADGASTLLAVTGAVALGNAKLDIALGYSPVVGDSFLVIDNDGSDAVSGTFAGLAEGTTFMAGDVAMSVTYHGGSGNDVVLSVVSPAPDAGAVPDAGMAADGGGTPDPSPTADAAITDPGTDAAASGGEPNESPASADAPNASDGCSVTSTGRSATSVWSFALVALAVLGLGTRARCKGRRCRR